MARYIWVAIGPNLVVRHGKVVTSPDERAKHNKSIRDRFSPDSYLEPALKKKHRPSESRPCSVPIGIPSKLTNNLIT
ncbi:hypothetical protein, partial [Pseudomonas putida]|uniref:hypothetical protein n=1 Tax=Pseudomonas putida TaxID=303 RepID=UPI0011AEF142